MTGQKAMSVPDNYPVLRELAATVPEEQAIVELGTYRGASAVQLATGAEDGLGARVWTIDAHDLPGYRSTTGTGKVHGRRLDYTDPTIREAAAATIKTAGVADRVTMMRDFSSHAGRVWGGPRVGMLYIDADHREGAVRRDFTAWEPHLARDAVIVFDDHHEWFPGVIRVVSVLVEKGILAEPLRLGTLAICNRA